MVVPITATLTVSGSACASIAADPAPFAAAFVAGTAAEWNAAAVGSQVTAAAVTVTSINTACVRRHAALEDTSGEPSTRQVLPPSQQLPSVTRHLLQAGGAGASASVVSVQSSIQLPSTVTPAQAQAQADSFQSSYGSSYLFGSLSSISYTVSSVSLTAQDPTPAPGPAQANTGQDVEAWKIGVGAGVGGGLVLLAAVATFAAVVIVRRRSRQQVAAAPASNVQPVAAKALA